MGGFFLGGNNSEKWMVSKDVSKWRWRGWRYECWYANEWMMKGVCVVVTRVGSCVSGSAWLLVVYPAGTGMACGCKGRD